MNNPDNFIKTALVLSDALAKEEDKKAKQAIAKLIVFNLKEYLKQAK